MRKKTLRKITVLFIVPIAIFSFLFFSLSAALPLLQQDSNTLVYARSNDSVTLDPAMTQDEESDKVIANIFEGLVRFKESSTDIEPCLAESWQVTANGLEWTFHLRKDVKFHDGTPFDAESVRFSFERQMPPQRTEDMAYASFVFGMVDELKVINSHTVQFTLKYPYAPFLNNLAMPAAAPIVSPTAVSALGDDFSSNPIGTGPFKFISWERGKEIILNINSSYWGQQPQYNRLVFTVIKNSRLRSLALKMNLVDIADTITPADAKYLEQNGYLVTKTTGLDLSYLGFFTDKEPFDNPAVRRAISMSIDREQLINTLFHDGANIANGPLPPAVLGYDPNNRPLPYDPDAAREVLSQNGLGLGSKITIITYSNSRTYNPVGGEKLAEAIKKDLALVGLEVEIKAYPWQQYKEALFKKESDAFLYGWISDNGDPDNFLYALLSSTQIESGLNIANYHNEKVDLLILNAQQEMNSQTREELYREAVKIIVQDAPWVFLNNSVSLAATSSQVEQFVLPVSSNALNTVIKKD